MKFVTQLLIGIIVIAVCNSYNSEYCVLQWEETDKIIRNIFYGVDCKVDENNNLKCFYFISSADNFDKIRNFYSYFSEHVEMQMWKNGLMTTVPGNNIKKIKIKKKASHYYIHIRTIDISHPDNEVKVEIYTREDDENIIKSIKQMKLPNGKIVEESDPDAEDDEKLANPQNTGVQQSKPNNQQQQSPQTSQQAPTNNNQQSTSNQPAIQYPQVTNPNQQQNSSAPSQQQSQSANSAPPQNNTQNMQATLGASSSQATTSLPPLTQQPTNGNSNVQPNNSNPPINQPIQQQQQQPQNPSTGSANAQQAATSLFPLSQQYQQPQNTGGSNVQQQSANQAPNTQQPRTRKFLNNLESKN